MENYTCLIVDDERLAQELLESYVQKIPWLESVASCSTAIEAMGILNQKEVDILFLDIQMPDLTGIDFLQSLKKAPITIFTTAYSEYAIEGFELGVADYLLKPIEFERFFKAMNKALGHLNKQAPIPISTNQSITPKEDYFFIKSDNKVVRIAFEEVLFIEALQKYIRIHTKEKRIVSLLSLSKIQELLPSNNFVRIHRSYIVNIDKIDNIEGNMVNINNHKLPISKGQKEAFLKKIKEKTIDKF